MPPAPTCLQLARRPRRQLTLEVRVSTMGVPSPTGPGSVRHGGRSARAVALPTQARRHWARRVGDMRLRRALGSPARINQTQSMVRPPWGRQRQWSSGSRRRRWWTERGGIGKSDPNTIVGEGMKHQLGLGSGSSGDGGDGDEATLIKRLIPKLRWDDVEDLRWAPSPCVWENQQCSHPQQLNACFAWLEAALWDQS